MLRESAECQDNVESPAAPDSAQLRPDLDRRLLGGPGL